MSQRRVQGSERGHRAGVLLILLLAVLIAAGCRLFRRGHRGDAGESQEPPTATVLATEPQVAGAIVFYREDFNFVVIEFDPGPMPRVGQDLEVEREGRVVGRVRANGPFKGRRAVADVVEGLVAAGDRVRRQSQPSASGR